MENDLLTSTFIQFRQKLTGLATRILHSEDDAADVVQDAFCKLWIRRGQIQSQREATGLSVTTVKHLCIDKVRHDGKELTTDLATQSEAITDEDESLADTFCEVTNIMDSTLTQTQSIILRKREYAGESFEEIAAEMEMTETAVRMQLSRARKLVREQFRKNQMR